MSDRPTHGWCQACKEESAINAAGNCLWCDGPTEQREPPEREADANGAAASLGLTHAHLRALHQAHIEQGATLEELAGRVAERVADKSPESAASLIRMGWNRLDLPIQETPRSEETMSTSARENGLETACEEIVGVLTRRPGEWLRAREIKAATGLTDGRFAEAMKQLRESERVRMEGQRAGARYLLADDDAPAPAAASNGKPAEEHPRKPPTRSRSEQKTRAGAGRPPPQISPARSSARRSRSSKPVLRSCAPLRPSWRPSSARSPRCGSWWRAEVTMK